MFVNIPNELIAEIETNETIKKSLLLLFTMFYLDDHQWLLGPDDDETLYDTMTLGSYRDFIKDHINRSIYRKPDRIVQVCTDSSMIQNLQMQLGDQKDIELIQYTALHDERLTIKSPTQIREVITLALIDPFLKQPLKIIVENIESDSLFIETCLLHFADIDFGDNRIKFENGGGSSAIHVANKLAGKHRVICIVDSDQESPGVIPEDKVKLHHNLREICTHYGYELYFLCKKEMENYLPESALEKYLTEERNFRICTEHPYFSRLSPEQRDFFDMKDGLPRSKLHHPIWNEIRAAFDEIATTNDKVKGFEKQIWRAFAFVESRKELEERDRQGELEKLVKLIHSLM